MFLAPPGEVLTALELLSRRGFEAYLVGGCVRDAVLGREPDDYDIATDAVPEEIKRVFSGYQTAEIGIRHGTLTVVMNGRPIELTSYRRDGVYSDGRHPDRVSFTKSLEEDLIRRDFTVNAMAWRPDGGLVDPSGGRNDCKNKLIRAVGEPGERFREDALRILRALRFAGQLGFEIERNTHQAMMREAAGLSRVSAERVAKELNRTLIGDFAANALRAYPEVLVLALPELKPLLRPEKTNDGIWEQTLIPLEGTPKDPALRWAALLLFCGKPQSTSGGPVPPADSQECSVTLAESILRRLRQPRMLTEQVITLIRHHEQRIDPANLRLWLSSLGPETAKKLLLLKRAGVSAKEPGDTRRIEQLDSLYMEAVRLLDEGLCLSVRDLQVKGDDLLAMGYQRNRRLGQALDELLRQVLTGELENRRDALLKAAESLLPID